MQKWVLVSVTLVVALSVVGQVTASTPAAAPDLHGSALCVVALLASGVLMYRARAGR